MGRKLQDIRLFEKLRLKKTKLLTSLTFLLRCRDHKTIPRFLQFHHHIHSRAANSLSTYQLCLATGKNTPKQTRIGHHIPTAAEYTLTYCQCTFRIRLGTDRPTHTDKSHTCGREWQGQTTQEVCMTPHKTTSHYQDHKRNSDQHQ